MGMGGEDMGEDTGEDGGEKWEGLPWGTGMLARLFGVYAGCAFGGRLFP